MINLLVEYTGQSRLYWVKRVQELIAQHTVTPEGAAHGDTDTAAAFKSLIDEVLATYPPKPWDFDENMRAAILVSSILALWYTRF